MDISIETARRILGDNKLSLNVAKSVVIKGHGESTLFLVFLLECASPLKIFKVSLILLMIEWTFL